MLERWCRHSSSRAKHFWGGAEHSERGAEHSRSVAEWSCSGVDHSRTGATEHALYTRQWGKEELVGGVYVDDLIITGACMEDINSFKREMAAHFRMSDLGAFS